MTYDPAYFKIPYPNGDVPKDKGVCTDVLIRAYRALGTDLQKEVHEDMAAHFAAYPNRWGRKTPDTNIDHRRVPNLMTFFSRRGAARPVTRERSDYLEGDIVAWDLGGGVTHIGLVAPGGWIVHNIGEGPKREDVLFSWKIIGHYRWDPLPVREFPVLTPRRRELTRAYVRAHDGLASEELKDPAIIVLHATEIPTLKATLETFKPDALGASRPELAGGGEVNVGVHFVVDRDGTVYSLLPLHVIGRHAIGLNHVSIGVENVGRAGDLTGAQAAADAALVRRLLALRPSVRFLIGHHEYADAARPHHALWKELDPSYKPTVKSDPGPEFMRRVRAALAAGGVRLAD